MDVLVGYVELKDAILDFPENRFQAIDNLRRFFLGDNALFGKHLGVRDAPFYVMFI
jgi:hypothetical protein